MERFRVIPAVHLFLVRGNQVLLLRRFNTGYEDGNYSVPAGHLDGQETVRDAMCREAREECGIAIALSDLVPVGVMHRRGARVGDERIDFFLAADHWSGQVRNCEPAKCDELGWYDMDGLPSNTIPYVREALAAFRRGEWYQEFGWS